MSTSNNSVYYQYTITYLRNAAYYIYVSRIENIYTVCLVYSICEKSKINYLKVNIYHVSTPLPRPYHLSGTGKKYRCIAAMKRARYSSGDIIVGSFP